MSDGRTGERPPERTDPLLAVETDLHVPAEAADVASAGRSCVVIILLAAAVLVVLCVGIAFRWASLQ